MQGRSRRFLLRKLVPLTISRGTSTGAQRLLVEISHAGITGYGETGDCETGRCRYRADDIEKELQHLWPQLVPYAPDQWQRVEPLLACLSPPARCGVDVALHDWYGKALGQPLWKLWGLDPQRCAATSVTVGLGTTDDVKENLLHWYRRLRPSRIKLKLGSGHGPDHDRQLVVAVQQQLEELAQVNTPTFKPQLQVDANGAWTLAEAKVMAPWLAQRDVKLLEQPLAPTPDDHHSYGELRSCCPMPLVVDESCCNLEDMIRLAPHVDGVNLKLLKSGGLASTLLMARVAGTLGLDLMLGCYSDSSILNGAAAQLLPLVRWPDLDSHLNLRDDPFVGLRRMNDVIQPGPGSGVGIAMDGPLPC